MLLGLRYYITGDESHAVKSTEILVGWSIHFRSWMGRIRS